MTQQIDEADWTENDASEYSPRSKSITRAIEQSEKAQRSCYMLGYERPAGSIIRVSCAHHFLQPFVQMNPAVLTANYREKPVRNSC